VQAQVRRRRSTATPGDGVLFWSGWGDAHPSIPGRQIELTAALAERVPVVTTEFVEPSRGLPSVEIDTDHFTERMIARIDAGALGRTRPRRLRQWITPALAPRLEVQLRTLGIRNYALLLMGSRGPYTTLGLQQDRTIVDLIDPPFEADSREILRAHLPSLTKGARLVTATAAELLEEARQLGIETFLLPNACREVPREVAPAPHVPTVGYLGTIDWRFDVDLVAEVARAMPETRFVLAGRHLDSLAVDIRKLLRHLPNVQLPGAVHPDATSSTLASFSMGIVPFKTGFVGDAINPVKVYEYLAAGIPVLATPIRECQGIELVTCAQGPEQWIAAIRDLLANTDVASAGSRQAFAARNTWRERADTLIDLMVDHGLVDPTKVRPRRPVEAARPIQ